MAETTGTATGLEDMMTKFLTFVGTASGWTVDRAITTIDTARECAIHKGNLFVQFRWNTASPNSIIMTQSTAFTVGVRAGTMTGDSNNGYNTANTTTEANITSGRCIELVGNSAMPSYYFYTNASGDYLHAVVEVATDEFRHFGCGKLEKFGDWDTMTGGEYAYGHVGFPSIGGSVTTINGSILLDGYASGNVGATAMIDRGATMRLAGAPGQPGAGVWAHIWANRTITEQVDKAGNARATCIGGARGGPIGNALGWIPAGSGSGLAPLTPIAVFYLNKVPSPNHVYLLGFQPDVRGLQLKNLAPKDTFVLGADTWRVFPTNRRREGAAAGDTAFQGWAYKT